MNWFSFVPDAIKSISGMYQSRQDRQKLKISTMGKLEGAKLQNKKEITLTDQEWEAVNANKADSTWKDEFVTVVILWPYIQLFIGGLEVGFKKTSRILDSLEASLTILATLGVDIGFLMTAVVMAAIGLKIARH